MRPRGVAAAALLLALCLLPAGMGAAMGQRSQARAAQDAGLAHTAQEQAEVLSDYFQRAQALTLLAARNSAFREFYEQPGSRVAKMRGDARLMDKINDGLGYLETLFPGSIGEACFIDRSGAEVARTVRGVRAILSGLSADESHNPFFAPTFALPIGSVYQARPYVSPDTEEWVISNSTPLDTPGGSKPAIIHFEVTLESFRAAAARTGQYTIDVVDAQTGHVIFDSRYPQVVGGPLGQPGDTRFAALTHSAQRTGPLTVDGRPAAFQHLGRRPGNANDWIVVAVAPTPASLLYGIGPLSIGLVVAAVLLVALAGLFDLLARRELVSAAMTDALTGLGNRRLLMRDLRIQLRSASLRRPLALMLFDLNGFKSYNDAYGHTAGDDLLTRLGRTLDAAVASRGRAYRLGGDEFCVLATVDHDGVDPTVAAATAALTEHGSGFTIDASYGFILLPSETQDASEALRLVDQRMYAQKGGSRRSADRQSKDVLLHALYERNPDLRTRLQQVGELVGRVAQRMGMSVEETQHAVQAAELRDIGQVAVPDAILAKQGELTDEERAFLLNQPMISERIIGAAPALAQVARLVRSTGERFDGSGHPDRLVGDAIPLGSRIVAACHQYVLLTSDPAGDARAVAAALAELRRQSGAHFDPRVVTVLAGVVTAVEMQAAPA
ncbi:MAG: HD domain-containing phosphohydrolase [Kineosporiaceae bacterium]